jgi:NAD(P)-dependent dehydrogenase (short-subunit alcohol dehydrogenase family)
MFDFSGKNVLVVGGTSGINRGIAECFASAGANVCVVSRSQEKVDDTVASLKALGSDAQGFAADVREFDSLVDGLKQVYDSGNTIDVLVSGAAGNFPALANGMSVRAFRTVVEIDLMGTLHVMKASHPHLTKPGASIINISAPQSFLAMVGQSHVCAAKAGVDQITRTLAMEWGREGIRVNSLVPGAIAGTEGMKRLSPKEGMEEQQRKSIPLKRLGAPKDLGNASMFLASEWASYITGTVLPIDGGLTLAGASQLSFAMEDLLYGDDE